MKRLYLLRNTPNLNSGDSFQSVKLTFKRMKLLIFCAALFLTASTFAQPPGKISYQAIVRNSSNQLVTSQNVGVRINILQGSAEGSSVYTETHTRPTNANGLVSLEIGGGAVVSGSFNAIDWSTGPYFIKTEIDPAGGTNYSITGTSQLVSVPYALYAKAAGNIDYNSVTNKPDAITSPNILIGPGAGENIITATGIVAVGKDALKNTTGNYNTAIGDLTLVNNTSGVYNAAVGHSALYNNTTGSYNTANGYMALFSNSSGGHNTACGHEALYSNTTGTFNTAIGHLTLLSNTTGSYNTANGRLSLYFNTSGGFNTAYGHGSLYNNVTGINNTANGYASLYSNNSGDNNTANGFESLYFNTTGFSNVAIGVKALYHNTIQNNNVAVGDSTLYLNGYSSTGGGNNTAIGSKALFNSRGYSNTAAGAAALYNNTSGYYNSAVGRDAMKSNTSGYDNVAMGYLAMNDNTTGWRNIAIGTWALYYNKTGNYNTAVGYAAGPASGYDNIGNTSTLGNGAQVTASNTIRIGNSSITQIGGQVGWSNLSDGRFKTNIKDNIPGIAFIMKLKPITFTWDMDKLDQFNGVDKSIYSDSPEMKAGRDEKVTKTYTGLIAQQVEQAAKECNYDFSGVIKPTNDKTPYNLSYAEFVVPLIKAVQEQNRAIELLKSKLEEQAKQIQELLKLLNSKN